MNTPDSSDTSVDSTTDSDLEDDNEAEMSDEQLALEELKNRARVLGVKFHPSIGEDKLREKVQAAMDDNATEEPKSAGADPSPSKDRAKIKADALALVRIRVTCMDPMKKEFQGDLFTTGNSLVGTVKRFIPFGVEWHVPRIMLNLLKEKEYQMFSTRKDAHGVDITTSRLVKTYAIEELPPLTVTEMKELAQRQAMAAGTAT